MEFFYFMFLICVCVHACHNQECGTYEIWHKYLKNLNRRVLLKRGICSQGFFVVWWGFFGGGGGFFIILSPPLPPIFPIFSQWQLR